MAEQANGIRANQEKIKKRMRDDIVGTQSVANQLTGQERVGTNKLKTGVKVSQPSPVANDKKLDKFLDFVEKNYKGSLLNVEVKRKI